MIEELKKNIETEIDILKEIYTYNRLLSTAAPSEKPLIGDTIDSLKASMKLVNKSIPKILNNVASPQKLAPKAEAKDTKLERVNFQRSGSEVNVVLETKDRDKFLQELSISENLIRRIKKKRIITEEKSNEFKAARGYVKLSNKYYLDTSIKWIGRGYFKQLSVDIKKANLDILFESYVAVMFFSTFLAIFAGIFLTVFFMFFNVTLAYPFISLFDGNYLLRFAKVFWIAFATPLAVFGALYLYPNTEKNSIEKRINQELPFAVIHMSAVSGSGIEPTQIFRIIGMSKEYPYLRREIRKVLNQINLYGYDLVTALTNVSKNTPSSKLAELFSGLSTTINSGGKLTEFFEKRAETLLVSYRLDREKFTKVAETFMDIYISVVIATPMILMLLLIMIQMSGIEVGFTPVQMGFLISLMIAVINVVFIGFLQIKQPAY